MNYRRILLSSLCLILGINTSLAGERTEREMLAIAQSHMAKRAVTRSVQNIEKLAEERFYSVYGNEQAFVIVGREDSFAPVLGYSDTHFDTNNIPCGMRWWLNAVSERMEVNTQKSFACTRGVSFTPVPHLCQTQWNQGDPYNFYTPEIDGKHTPTGCVATAMSQIMKYFGYPAQGKGKGYYTLSTNASSRVYEDIAGVYQWDKMLNTYNGVELTDEIRMPVAQLMKDAGLAINMMYGTDGSSASTVIVARGLSYNFGYDSLALRSYYREFFNQEMWMNTIYNELVNGRPIIYRGSSDSGGHAFVFDGVDDEGKIHINWGWGGEADGYYDIADLNPIGSNSHYNDYQAMVFGFKCQETPDENEEYTSLWCTDSGKSYTLGVEGKILKVNSPPVFNYHFLWFYGQFGAFFKNMNGDSSKDVFIKIGQDQNAVATFNGTNDLNNSVFFTKVKSGKYQVYLASKAINEKTCQPVRCSGGAPYYEVTITEDGETSISEVKYFDDAVVPTAISTVKTAPVATQTIYNLQGRNMGTNLNVLPRGIYIIGGKKVGK